MTLLEMLTAALAVGKVSIVAQEAADPDIVIRVSFPNPVANLLPATVREGSQGQTVLIPLKAGVPYTFSFDLAGADTSYLQVYRKGAKGKSALCRQTGPGHMVHNFTPTGGDIGLVFEPKGAVAGWSKGELLEGAAVVVEPPPVEPPPVEPPVEVPPPPPVEPPPVVVDPPPVEPPPPPPVSNKRTLIGLNLSNAEMGGAVPGQLNKDYAYPKDDLIRWCAGAEPATAGAYALAKPFQVLRVCFKWRRLITTTTATTFKAEISELRRIVKLANSLGMIVWLDMHDYGRYQGNPIGHPVVPIEFFARSWGMFAAEFKDADVWYGLMNEPHDQDGKAILQGANAAIAAIRAAGGTQKILVPALAWSGAHAFLKSTAPLLEAIPIVDPLNDWAFEVHQYLDEDSSGTHATVVKGKGAGVLAPFTEWCAARGVTAVLGEYGVGRDADSLTEMRDMVGYACGRPDVWLALAYWAGGAWWKADYIRAVGPDKTNEQIGVVQEFMS